MPSRGTQAVVNLTYYVRSPEAAGVERTNDGVTQLEGGISRFWSWHRRNRLFAIATGGTSFDGHPISQFELGYPFRLDAFRIGERRGDHYGVLTLGAARQVGRLPDFIGGPVFVGSWFENGSAFDTHENADINSQIAFGACHGYARRPGGSGHEHRVRRWVPRLCRDWSSGASSVINSNYEWK